MTRNDRMLLIAGAIYGVLGLVFLVFGSMDLYRVVELRDHAALTLGRVTAKDTARTHGRGFNIRYEFVVAGATYTPTDLFGRRNLWFSLPRYRWTRISPGDELPVRYLPEDPSINRPADATSGMPDAVAAVLVGAVAVAIGSIALRRRNAMRTAPSRR